MQTLRRLLLTLTLLSIPLIASGQEPLVVKPTQSKMTKLTTAIAHAEGFGVHRAIPTRYHNPGDLKCIPRRGCKFEGTRGVGKGGHTIFKNDAAGWAALRTQIQMILDGSSKNFHKDMTINDMAKRYAKNWHRWAKNVSNELEISPTTTLADYFDLPVEPPQLTMQSPPLVLADLFPSNPVLPVLVQN